MTNDLIQENVLEPEEAAALETAQEQAYTAYRLARGECPLLAEALS